MKYIGFLIALLASTAVKAQELQRMPSITDVQIQSTRSVPPIHHIVVEAVAPTPGWSDITFREMGGKNDGYLHLEMVGRRPQGAAAQTVTRLRADYGKPIVAQNYFGRGRPLKGVVVYGESNKITGRFAN